MKDEGQQNVVLVPDGSVVAAIPRPHRSFWPSKWILRRVRTLRLLAEISLSDSLISSRDKFSRAPTSAAARIRTSSRRAWQANLLRNETIIEDEGQSKAEEP